jgi:hypothetical protein
VKKIDLAQMVTIFANVGVIVGIGFLALEIRQNTNAVETAALQGMLDVTANYLLDIGTDREQAQLRVRGREDFSQLDEYELEQTLLMVRGTLFRWQGAFLHRERGSLRGADWEAYDRFICPRDSSPSPVLAYFWPMERHRFTDDFVEYIEACRPEFIRLAD